MEKVSNKKEKCFVKFIMIFFVKCFAKFKKKHARDQFFILRRITSATAPSPHPPEGRVVLVENERRSGVPGTRVQSLGLGGIRDSG